MRRLVLIWCLAFVSATVFSLLVGVVGFAENISPFPPMGGGVFKLIVLPICGVWVFFLGLGFVAADIERARAIREDASKTLERRSNGAQQAQQKEI